MGFRFNFNVTHGGQLQGFRCVIVAPEFNNKLRGIITGAKRHDDEVFEGSSEAPRTEW